MVEIEERYLNQKDIKGQFDTLPKMVASHSKRVVNIVKFIVKRLEVADFFDSLHSSGEFWGIEEKSTLKLSSF